MSDSTRRGVLFPDPGASPATGGLASWRAGTCRVACPASPCRRAGVRGASEKCPAAARRIHAPGATIAPVSRTLCSSPALSDAVPGQGPGAVCILRPQWSQRPSPQTRTRSARPCSLHRGGTLLAHDTRLSRWGSAIYVSMRSCVYFWAPGRSVCAALTRLRGIRLCDRECSPLWLDPRPTTHSWVRCPRKQRGQTHVPRRPDGAALGTPAAMPCHQRVGARRGMQRQDLNDLDDLGRWRKCFRAVGCWPLDAGRRRTAHGTRRTGKGPARAQVMQAHGGLRHRSRVSAPSTQRRSPHVCSRRPLR